MDRRGHGRSDWGASAYSIDREYDDVAAVLAAAGPGASLVGHSFGAICTLGAALRTPVRRLVVYEPPLPIRGLIAGEYLAPFCSAVAERRLEDALEIGIEKFVRLPAGDVEAMRTSSAWPRLSKLVPSWPRELQAMDGLDSSVERYGAITCPTLLLLGTRSAPHPFRHATAALSAILPDVRVASLEGQSHMAMRAGKELVAHEISQFLLS